MWAHSWYYTLQDNGSERRWGKRTHQPLGCKRKNAALWYWATMESVATVSTTARESTSSIFTRIPKAKSSSPVPLPYSPSGNFTSTPTAMSDLAIEANRLFL